MRRAFLLVALLALVVAPTGNAHRYNDTMQGMAGKFSERLNDYRIHHGGPPLVFGPLLALATTALNIDNYRRAKWTTRLDGIPWVVWNDAFTTPDSDNIMMITRHCNSEPYKPRRAVKRLMSHKIYRLAFMLPSMKMMAVRVTATHRHTGAFKGRRRCILYYAAVSS